MSPFVRSGSILLLLLIGALGCSSAKSNAPVTGPHPDDETWADGKHIDTSVVIPTGATVTIAAGAKITVAKGATITVGGKLQAQNKASHAKISGDGWGGIIVNGGALDLEGVDLDAAATAIDVQNGTGNYVYGTVTNSVPFKVEQDGQLTVAHATVVGATDASQVLGAFTATFLDYETLQHEGVVAKDPGATISIEDSKFHGQGAEENDLIMAQGAASVHVAYVDLSKMHCGFHFDYVSTFDISYVSVHDGAYGMMFWGSDTAGARTVTHSNLFSNHANGIDEGNPSTQNGPITVSDGYWANNGSSANDNIKQYTGQITISNMSSTTQVDGAGPRGAVGAGG